MKSSRLTTVVGVAFCLCLFSLPAHASTLFFYTSSPESWVGHGETVSVDPALGFDFLVTRYFGNNLSFVISDFSTNPDFQSRRSWSLDFAAPGNADLLPGIYLGAERFPFQNAGQPGLSFAGNGRGDNTLTGQFTVLDAQYLPTGGLLSFAADFIQYDEGRQEAWNSGGIRYNSEVPTTATPEPAALTLLMTGLIVARARIVRTGRARNIRR